MRCLISLQGYAEGGRVQRERHPRSGGDGDRVDGGDSRHASLNYAPLGGRLTSRAG